MGLITYEQLEDDVTASANLWNERFGKLYAEFNGKIDSDNIKVGGVSRENLSPGSVSSDKLDITKEYDENGWLVTDYGTTKSYVIEKTGTVTLGSNAGAQIFEIPLPVGTSNINDLYLTWSSRQFSQEIQYTVFQGAVTDKIQVRAWNNAPTGISGHAYTLTFHLEPKG